MIFACLTKGFEEGMGQGKNAHLKLVGSLAFWSYLEKYYSQLCRKYIGQSPYDF
jgi:hypothetical protein